MLIFVKTSWMARYAGEREMHGNYRFVRDHEFGHELFNFSPYEGRVYGHIPTNISLANSHWDNIIEDHEDHVNHVTVVFTATNPRSGGQYVVGFYRDATIHRERQPSPHRLRRVPREHRNISVQIVAQAENATLIDVEERGFEVEGFGRSSIWYGNDEIRERVSEYINDPLGYLNTIQRGRERRVVDPEQNSTVERMAIQKVIQHYRNHQYAEINSVEVNNCGWDLEASLGGIHLCIEVKGLSGDNLSIQLTPNEYGALTRSTIHNQNRDISRYVLAVVTNINPANEGSGTLYIFNKEINNNVLELITQDDMRLTIRERTGAVLSL